jgi:hypothetical protein
VAEIRVFYRDTFLCGAICQELAGQTINALRAMTQQAIEATREQLVIGPPCSCLPPLIAEHSPPDSSEDDTPDRRPACAR